MTTLWEFMYCQQIGFQYVCPGTKVVGQSRGRSIVEIFDTEDKYKEYCELTERSFQLFDEMQEESDDEW